ncbi:hypothetical protein CDL15_Pgr014584 [Punica granatum]|uniref:Uncharacterized protein n=1 Tax=Punica granatum TaxID=22663 RepID=A0A218WFB4_PUNGR|nr:hypothetical protein CDL15_Pgr014584 [Punica granatum]
MAGAGDKISVIFTVVILVSLLFLSDLVHGRKRLTSEPKNDKTGLEETIVAGDGGFQLSHPNISSCLIIMLQDQAVPGSTSAGHTPGVGDSSSESVDVQPADPGDTLGAGDSTGLNVQNPGQYP